MFLRRRALLLLATGLGAGKIPFAPGTLGSLVGLAPVWLLARLNCPTAAAVLTVMTLGAVWAAHSAERELGRKDPGCIVIDEIIGMCVTLLCLPLTWYSALIGFLLFRLFDITKPPPLRRLERLLPGGWGVVADDAAAGIMAHLVLRCILALNL